MTRFVLDASFALTWVLEKERGPETLRHFDALVRREAEALVPALWIEEIMNATLSAERSKRLTAAQALTWLELFQNLPILVHPPSMEESFGEVRLLAQSHGLTGYDARYLHLAMWEGVPIATCDKQIIAAAPKVGVKLVV